MKNKYSSVIMFKERFNPMDDIIISFAYTNNESADKGAIRLQGSTYNNELLNSQTDNTILYNQPSDFNGLGVFLMDGKIAYNSLSGGGMSSAVSAFDLGANLINSPYLSSGLRFLRQPNNLSGSFVPSLYDKKTTPAWANEYYIAYGFDSEGANYGEKAAIFYDDTLYGWSLSSYYYSQSPATLDSIMLYTTLSAGSGVQPWDVAEWQTLQKSTYTGPLSVGPSFTSFFPFTGSQNDTHSVAASSLDNPGMNLVSNNLQPQYSGLPNLIGESESLSGYTALSGCFLIAALDNNGAFGYQYSGIPLFNNGTEYLSAGNFAVRTIPAGISALDTTNISAFRLTESVTPTDNFVVEDNWKVLRIGFRRRMQDVVLYKRRGDIYEVDHVIPTYFSARTLPTSAVSIGLTYSGKMPIEIKNITINASTDNTKIDAEELNLRGGIIESPDVEIVTMQEGDNMHSIVTEDIFVTINK